MKGLKVPRNALGVTAQHPLSCGKGKEREPRLRALRCEAREEQSPLAKPRRRYRPPDVRTIFAQAKDPRVKQEKGEGHHFDQLVSENAWCDLCCHFVCGQFLRCTDCKYTCHTLCRDLVQLDCQHNDKSTDPSPCPGNVVQQHLRSEEDVEKEREPQKILTKEEIKQKIEVYNSTVTDRLKMTLNSNEVYTGFIKVQMDLRRPITIRPMTTQGSHPYNNNNEIAFYMPKDTTNTLHISSSNTVKEVIEALLKKFMVADNPAKFALFKRSRKEEQVHMSKLLDAEHPLYLRLLAGPSSDTLGFVLREHETGEVLWEAFSLPELQNFLRILAKEEDDQFQHLKRRYGNYRTKLEEALRATGKPG
ncbi:ras association domain-containing protein 3 isoform X1 [Carcharodon carcharias]|uniref:ras association domain-containing protein 3 isoform X1 n=1 Tax=Carcharodon carcharias TaxID=13397 RepID=UPI001B7E6E7A|nr:ras association domain-containing protein 3 isoform X1 [Carcharodon carcharias]